MNNPNLDRSFLPFFLNEKIYLIDETTQVPKKIRVQKVEEPKEIYEPTNSVLIISEYGENLPADQKEYLGKILGAVKLNLNSVDYSNNGDHMDSYRKVICFGGLFENSPTAYAKTKELTHELLVADPLQKISESIELRKKLWSGLQDLFEL